MGLEPTDTVSAATHNPYNSLPLWHTKIVEDDARFCRRQPEIMCIVLPVPGFCERDSFIVLPHWLFRSIIYFFYNEFVDEVYN